MIYCAVYILAFDYEHAAVFGADDQSGVGPRVAAHDIVAKVRVEALRFPGRPLEQPRGGQAGGRIPFDDGVQLERLPDPYELHLPCLLFAPRTSRGVWQHVAERPSVQHCLRQTHFRYDIFDIYIYRLYYYEHLGVI